MHRISTEQRRRRLARRHHLGSPANSIVDVAGDLVGLHSSDPSSVYLAARARVADLAPEDLETVLYDDRSLVRMLGMRRTLFVVPRDIAAVMNVACTQALIAPEQRRLVRMLEDQAITDDGARWVDDVATSTLGALSQRGEATAVELSEAVPELKEKLTFGEGKAWAGSVGLSTRMLFLLATEGKIVRGRPLGSWISSQYRWATTEGWLGGLLPSLDSDQAVTELATRWLSTFGPGTLTDLKWWTGWTVAKTKEALAAAGAVEVELEDGSGFALADDLGDEPDAGPWVSLLPGLDSTAMGWKERDWYLDGHQKALFDRNGNVGPTVWVDGRIVGGWAQRKDGEVVHRFLEDVGTEVTRMIADAAGQLQAWLGDIRIIPRFRSPLEKELSA